MAANYTGNPSYPQNCLSERLNDRITYHSTALVLHLASGHQGRAVEEDAIAPFEGIDFFEVRFLELL
jgi:hypothetical protein